jgi:hypothetical protein
MHGRHVTATLLPTRALAVIPQSEPSVPPEGDASARDGS